MHLVFVYGTLRRGQRNHDLISGADFKGPCQLAGFDMFDTGTFPFVRTGTGMIHGEVYRISPAQLARLDQLEGHPDFYQRTPVTTPWGEAWLYLFPRALDDSSPLPGGDWVHRHIPTDNGEQMLYFAYGSNMLTERLVRRVPSARPLGPARVQGHQLRFHKIGTDGSGKGDLFQTEDPAHHTHGVVFQFAQAQLERLHAAEGLGYGYDFKWLEVESEQGQLRALTYVATRIQGDLAPYDWYLGLVLGGALEHGLPDHYIEHLRQVEAPQDPDPVRRAHHLEIIRAGGISINHLPFD